jgi:hypothetical protein
VTGRLILVVALGGTVVATATADVNADVNLEIRLPLPALPLGPGPLYPLDSYGPQADDNAVLRWGEQTLSAIRALLNLFPARTSDFRGLMSAMGYDPDDASTDPASPTGIGNQAAAAVLAFRANDRSNQANGYADTTGYVPVNTPDQVNDPFRWQPLRFVRRQRQHRGPEVPDPAVGLHHPVRNDLPRPVPAPRADLQDPGPAGRGGHRHPDHERHPPPSWTPASRPGTPSSDGTTCGPSPRSGPA